MEDNHFLGENLDDYMEVVMTYKCKFCEFTCNATQQMGQHVRSAHQTYTKPQGQGQAYVNQQLTNGIPDNNTAMITESTVDISTDTLDDHFQQTETQTISNSEHVTQTIETTSNHESNGETNIIVTDELQNNLQTDNHVSNNQTNIIVTDELQNSLQQEILTVATDGNMIEGTGEVLGETVSMSNIQFINPDGSSGQFILQDGMHFENGSTVQVLVHNPDFEIKPDNNEGLDDAVESDKVHSAVETESGGYHFVIENGEAYSKVDENTSSGTQLTSTEIQTETDPNVINEDSETVQVEQTDGNNNPGDDTAGNENPIPQEVELFLCGNCQQGFTTIHECKDHMKREHSSNDPPPGTKVDTGTQMEPRKKVGRKRKSEIAAAAKEEVHVEIVISDSDEDWSEKMDLYSYSKRSQRRRQPPQTLRNDFYLGRSQKKDTKKREDPGLNIKCTVKGCTARFKEKDTLEKHLSCHIPGAKETDFQFNCLVCEAQFIVWKQARYHMWKQHKLDMDLLTCPTCLTFKTDTMSKLKIHQEIHSVDRPYTCGVCGKGFKQLAQMKNHESSHEEVKNIVGKTVNSDKWNTPKTCDICERTFCNAKSLKIHKDVVHSQKKPFKCQYCGHECSRKAMMILHERIHTGAKPFKCELCQYSCGDHNSLRRHKMRHTGERPYKCPHCPYSCIQAISLKVHIKNKHPGMGGIYNCSMCLFRTVNEQQFENHMKDHKNGLIEKTVENAENQVKAKPTVKHRRTKNTLPKTFTAITVPNNAVHNFGSLNGPVQSSILTLPQIVHIPASAFAGVGNEMEPLEMQIEMKEDGNHIITSEELAKLTGNEGLGQTDPATAQLIYSALSAISQNAQNEVQTSIQTGENQGVTTHTITFHLPESEVLASQENIVEEEQKDEEATVIQLDVSHQQWPTKTSVDLENT